MSQRDTSWRAASTYRLRVLGGGVVALLLCVGVVRWWPASEATPNALYSDRASDRIQLEEIQPTDHDIRRQPPPAAASRRHRLRCRRWWSPTMWL